MSWTPLGQITVLPTVESYTLGPVDLNPNDDTLWVRSRAVNYDPSWPYSFGLVSYLSSEGFELGTIKVFAKEYWEPYELTVGRPPLQRSGVLQYVPRSFNLAWTEKKNIPELVLELEYQSGEVGDGEPLSRGSLCSFVDLAGTTLKFVDTGTGKVALTYR